MFNWIVRYLGFLKEISLLAHFFDSLLRLKAFVTRPILLDWLDEIESELLNWKGITISMHPYGGLQFNYSGREVGHLHSNGLLDVLFNQEMKKTLLVEGRISAHHIFPKSGWVSFYLREEQDVSYAKKLLLLSYQQKRRKWPPFKISF